MKFGFDSKYNGNPLKYFKESKWQNLLLKDHSGCYTIRRIDCEERISKRSRDTQKTTEVVPSTTALYSLNWSVIMDVESGEI